jgi:hypothetical protein
MTDGGGDGFDANGWAEGSVAALERASCWSLFSADATLRLDQHLLSHKSRDLFDLEVRIEPPKDYSRGGAPVADRCILHLGEAPIAVRVLPIERAGVVLAAANDVARAMGGAGMDVLLKRARKLIQIESTRRDRASLSAACLLSTAYLAVILPPDEDALFAIKGARERLALLPAGPEVDGG